MNKISREILLEILEVDAPTVTFVKKNGDEREMRCTLREDLIPESAVNTNEEIINVYDLENKAWRSFRVDSIKAVQSAPGKPKDDA